jgi:hypothetical protein
MPSLSDRADDDVRIAAAEVHVDAPVTGDLTIAGRDVVIGSRTSVSGRSRLIGGTVRLDGVFEREVRVAEATVQIAGEIRRPLAVTAETPSARILGPLTHKGSTIARFGLGAPALAAYQAHTRAAVPAIAQRGHGSWLPLCA